MGPNGDRDDDRGTGAERSADLEELAIEECEQLLGSAAVGRIAVARDDGPPLVVPVNYVYADGLVVLRTGPGTKLEAMRTRPVTFQVDAIDLSHRTGWSVMVEGEVHVATRTAPSDLLVDTWVPGPRPFYARIVPTLISGRRIRLPDLPLDGRAYL